LCCVDAVKIKHIFFDVLQLEKNKKDHKDALKKGVHFLAEELKADQTKLKENLHKCKSQKAQNEVKLEQYKTEIAQTDERLETLGQTLESLETLCKNEMIFHKDTKYSNFD